MLVEDCGTFSRKLMDLRMVSIMRRTNAPVEFGLRILQDLLHSNDICYMISTVNMPSQTWMV